MLKTLRVSCIATMPEYGRVSDKTAVTQTINTFYKHNNKPNERELADQHQYAAVIRCDYVFSAASRKNVRLCGVSVKTDAVGARRRRQLLALVMRPINGRP